MSDDDLPGLPPPPAVGATALVPGTFEGRCVIVTGGGTGLGKAIASSSRASEPRWSSPAASRAPRAAGSRR